MNIQIFGTKKCNDTKKAQRFGRSFEELRAIIDRVELQDK